MLKKTFFDTKKSFHFISKALFVLEMFKYKNLRILIFKSSSNVYTSRKK